MAPSGGLDNIFRENREVVSGTFLSAEQLAEVIQDSPGSLGLNGPVRAIAAVAFADGRSATVAYAGPGDQRLWPAKSTPPDPGPVVIITSRGPLPGLPATVYFAAYRNNIRIDTWILPPPPGQGQRLLGHVGDVTAATLTAPVTGEDYALSAGDDGTIRYWRLQLGQGVPHGMVERNQRPSALVTSSLGDLGQVVITGGVDGQLRIWSLRDGSTVGKPLSGNGYAVRSLESKGTYVGVLHQNGKLRIWDLATGNITEMTPVGAFAFTTVDGRLAVAVRTASNTLQVYDLSRSQWSGKPTPLDGQSHDYVEAPILSVNSEVGCKLILAENQRLRAVDVESGESGERESIVLGDIDETAKLLLMSTNGLPCLVAITSPGVAVWDLRGKPPLPKRTLPADVTTLPSLPDLLVTGHLPDGTAVAVLGHSKEQKFCFLDPDDMTTFGVIATGSVIDALGISEDGTVVIATEFGLLAITPSGKPSRSGLVS